MDLQSTITLSLIIIFLAFIHELGHFIIARLNNVNVGYFAIGFGPHLASFKDSKGTTWCINLIPLGGYVEMAEDGNETDTMLEMSPITNILISLGGPLINILLFLFGGTFFYYMVGLNVIEYHRNDMTFYIRPYDKENPPNQHYGIKKDQNNNYKSVYLTHTKNCFKKIVLDDKENKENIINIDISLINAFKLSLFTIKSVSYKIIYTFTHWSELKKIRSILGAYKQIKFMMVKTNSNKDKIKNIIFYLLMFSLQLGLFNLLPITGLDGFWVLISIINLIFRPSLSFQRKLVTLIDYGTRFTFFLMGALLFRDIYELIVEFFI
jgi:regulator of sigma E protease